MKICIHCRSTNVTTRASIEDRGEQNNHIRPILRLRFDKDPDALLLKDRHHFDTVTRLCLDCGFVALFCPGYQTIGQLIKEGP